MSKAPTLSIVVPAYNEIESIERCLQACLEQTSPALEVLVVDNLSTDGTASVVEELQARYKDSPTRLTLLKQTALQGITPTRNYGFDRVQGDIIGRIDADSIPDADWVEQIQRIFSDDEVDAATGPVLYHDMPAKKLGKIADDQVRSLLGKMSKDYKFLFGSNMAIRQTVWQEIKGELCSDPDNLMHEDVDLAVHLTQAGYNIVYDSQMVSGVSARRLENTPREFYAYIMRNERTYKEHNFNSPAARVPIIIYLATYFPFRTLRLAYNSNYNRLSLATFVRRFAESKKREDEPETEKSLLDKL